jgi:WXG100 family type VII secretion target
MTQRQVPTQGLRRVAEEFARAGRVSEETLTRLDRMLEALEREWDGATQEAFYLQFRSLRPHMARLGAHLDLIAREVDGVVERFESVDRG